MVKFNQIFVRNLGFSLKIYRLLPVTNLPSDERLLCALIGKSKETALALLELKTDKNFIEDFVALVERTGFAGLVLNELFELEIINEFNQNFYNGDLKPSEKLAQLAARESANHRQNESKFRDVLVILEQHLQSILWIKGAHLCRAIYPEPQFRQFGDFDVIVHPSSVERVIETLEQNTFISTPNAANCNQFGAGPTLHSRDLFLSPRADWIPTSAVTMKQGTKYDIDIKLGPFDRGLQIRELDRLFSDAVDGSCMKHNYKAPCNVDHLMIMLRNLEKDRFRNWKSLLDVHLLSNQLSKDEKNWQIFLERCDREAVKTSAWVGLSLVVDRFATAVPSAVIDKLQPGLLNSLSFLASPTFTWNSCGLPSLLFNAITSEDWSRKFLILASSFFPSVAFLSQYYKEGKTLKKTDIVLYTLVHWCVLVLPAGVTRRTFGRKLWPNTRMLGQSR